MANVLKKITAEAKRIYARGGTWRGAIKSAGVKYRAGKLGRVASGGGKKRKPAKRARRVGSHKPVIAAAFIRGRDTIAGFMSGAKKLLADRIASAERGKFLARTKRAKRVYGKQIAEYKRQYRKLS